MSDCPCAELRARPFRDVRDGIHSKADEDRLLPWLDKVPTVERSSADPWLVEALRCRGCGSGWARGCYASGHMEIYYVFPVEADDLAAWFASGECLPRPPWGEGP